MTVNAALPAFFGIPGFDTLHRPFVPVTQFDEPEAPPVQLPVTVAPATALWPSSST